MSAAVASALRVGGRVEHSVSERIVEFLRARRTLIVLDNCEHVVGGAAALVRAILLHTTAVDVLATSRLRLGVEGEHVVPVGPLTTTAWDDIDGPAAVLFADRAAAVRPGFVLSDDNAAGVCRLCHRLDGVLLAIELAAARILSRTPAEILAAITERMGDLSDTRRALGRHRSIDAVVAWSYDLLTPDERAIFEGLAVFVGGFTAGAATAVLEIPAGELGDALTSLAEHSLVVAHPAGGRSRFSILEPIRQYAEARLGDRGRRDEIRDRHAAWYAQWTRTADRGLRGPDELLWATRLDAELANLRAALHRCHGTGPRGAVDMTAALFWYASWYGPSEVYTWADQTAARFTDTCHPQLAGAFATAALGAWRRGDLARSRALAESGVQLAPPDDPTVSRFSWQALSSAAVVAGDYEQALACYDEAISMARRAGDTTHEAREHGARALVLGYLGQTEAALEALSSATDLLRAAPNPTVEAFCEYVGGEILLEEAPRDALPRLRRSREAAWRIGNRYLAAISGVSAVSCAARIGDPAEAIGGYAELIDYFHRAGAWAQQWTAIRTLVETLARLGLDEPATVLHGALTASPRASPLIGADAARIREAVAVLRARLGNNRFEELSAQGASLGDEHAVSYALSWARGER